jgi:arylsulfatase A
LGELALKLLLILGLVCSFCCWNDSARGETRPNILFILTDDQGWPSLGCYGGKHVPTPHLDKLAADGARCTAAYVTPQCTPTRAAILSGQHPARSRMWHVIPWYGYPWAPVREPAFTENLPRETFTVAKGLHTAGYRTACLGKWHLTNNADGSYTGLNAASSAHYGFDVVSDPKAGHKQGDKDVAALTDQAIAFIKDNKDRPWFCYLAHHTVHGPVIAPAELVEKHRSRGAPAEGLHNATYLAALEHLDNSIGRLLSALDELRLTERTLVVFLSDNGGVSFSYDIKPFKDGPGTATTLTIDKREYDNAPLRGTKGQLYEAGIRVPCLVRWPGVTKPGTVIDTPIQATDWLPTLLDAGGTKPPDVSLVDGISLRPLLGGSKLADRALYWHAPLYDLRWAATPASAIRNGRYKLILFHGDSFDAAGKYRPGERVELYDLEQDPGETRDLTQTERAKAQELQVQLAGYLDTLKTDFPTANKRHDPKQPLRETREKPE